MHLSRSIEITDNLTRLIITKRLTNIVDKLLYLRLHSPVLELHFAQLIGAHDGFSVGEGGGLALHANKNTIDLYQSDYIAA